MYAQIRALLAKELRIEWRQKYAISGILLYVFATVFVVFISFDQIELTLWNGLYWMVLLFSAINAVAKSFVQERSQRHLYYYSLADPLAVLWAKIIYNGLLLIVLQLLIFGSLAFVAGAPPTQWGLFLGTVALISIALSVILTFVAAIGGHTQQVAVFTAILSFPMFVPVFLLMIPVTASALGSEELLRIDSRIIGLTSIDLLLLALSGFLFPYLWTD